MQPRQGWKYLTLKLKTTRTDIKKVEKTFHVNSEDNYRKFCFIFFTDSSRIRRINKIGNNFSVKVEKQYNDLYKRYIYSE